MTKSEIVVAIKALKLNGFGGQCANAAIEINTRVFGGRGAYVAGLNEFWLDRGVARGHVAVRFQKRLWDSSGEISEDDLLSWGELDYEDPDYATPGWTAQAAETTVLVEFDSEAEVLEHFKFCSLPRRKKR